MSSHTVSKVTVRISLFTGLPPFNALIHGKLLHSGAIFSIKKLETLWNSLDSNIKSVTSLNTFRRKLPNLLLSQLDSRVEV